MSADWEVQKAVYDALAADSTFMGLISNNLYDEPPTNQDYPYVAIGDSTEQPDNTLNSKGYDGTVTLHIHTRPAGLGFKTAKGILARMNVTLNLKILTMTSLTMLVCKFENAMTERENDKRIISVRYRVLSQ